MNRQDVEKTITEYLKPIFGFALKRCKSIHDAEDLSQEIAIRAFRALLIKEDIADMGKFIWTVAHNTLGIAKFDDGEFEKQIEHIDVLSATEMVFYFKDGRTVSRTWEQPKTGRQTLDG